MVGANFMEEIDSGNFFDNIDDLLEFPNDDIDNLLIGKGGGSVISSDDFLLWQDNSVDSDLPAGSNSIFSSTNSNGTSDHSVEFSVPYEDIVQLEWLSSFVEHSSSGEGLTLEKAPTSPSTKESSRNQFKTSSPVSVLESSDACSNGTKITLINEKRPRSKRSRPAAFTPRVGFRLTPPTSSIAETPQPLEREPKPILGEQEKKKKKIKILSPSSSSSVSIGASRNQNESRNANNPRKCMHCEITKTPQWRAGPMGPKTLCNACGVRYKSGRLFPEYRPAASPTFVPSLHSNSHKKVLEMRNNIIAEKSKIENRS